MSHSGDGGLLEIGGGTRFTTAETMFLEKGGCRGESHDHCPALLNRLLNS
ncbi:MULTISPECIES: hypothetical protein [unclassified Streptomyces]|nr:MULTISPECIES: hypothetical protein [unclassified Streptomyces]MDF3141299.1 hypothetical protein [Streptomyces sp. T21Q-yed]WDF43275.1 hypothetical protein PBV52_44030 [Streptomyces sp. T12]